MSPNKQIIAIAEATGYRDGQLGFWEEDVAWTQHWNGNPTAIYIKTGLRCNITDYLNDLNAMHEAEEVLLDGSGRFDKFVDILESRELTGDCALAVHATAAQRAEAFLRTLGLWTD